MCLFSKISFREPIGDVLRMKKNYSKPNISIKNTREVLVKLHVALPKVVYLLFIIIMWSISILLVRTKVKQKKLCEDLNETNPKV